MDQDMEDIGQVVCGRGRAMLKTLQGTKKEQGMHSSGPRLRLRDGELARGSQLFTSFRQASR